MQYVEAPNRLEPGEVITPSLFLAGGITGCPDWQKELAAFLFQEDIDTLVAFNPRREDFPMGDPNAGREQIAWEFDHLCKATAISFWFCKETICPIVLYELGYWAHSDKRLFVGMDPEYSRRFDVETQLGLARRDKSKAISYSLVELGQRIRDWAKCCTGALRRA